MQGKIKIAKIDVDQENSLSKELQITAMPTFVFFKDGKIIDRHVGALSKEELLTKCAKNFA